jgi:hypothetical protein
LERLFIFRNQDNIYEFDIITSVTVYHVIVGKSSYGYYLCIPNYEIGYHIDSPTDLEENHDKLSWHIGTLDSARVVCGLYALSKTHTRLPDN